MNRKQFEDLAFLLSTVKGLSEQLHEAKAKVKKWFSTNRIARTPENMAQVCAIMVSLYDADAVVGITAQGSIAFRNEGARSFFFANVNPGIAKLRKAKAKPTAENSRQAVEKQALRDCKRIRTNYGAGYCRLLGALLMAQ